MNEPGTESLEATAQATADRLTAAWMERDGNAFAREFADDADFVNIFGMPFRGRDAVARQHQAIFDSIYRNSRVRFSIARVRRLGAGTMIAFIRAALHVADGPLYGDHATLASAVLAERDGAWQIVAFHNTECRDVPAG